MSAGSHRFGSSGSVEGAGIRFPIGFKLSIIVSLILAVSLSLITFLVASLVGADVRLTAENNNLTMNHWSAISAENTLTTYKDNSLFLIRSMDLVSREGTRSDLEALTARFFRLNPDLFCIAFIGEDEHGGMVLNEHYSSGADSPASARLRLSLSQWLENHSPDLEWAAGGRTTVVNPNTELGFPCLVMFFPLVNEQGFSFSGAAAVFFSPSLLEENLYLTGIHGTDHTTFIINSSSDILVEPKTAFAAANNFGFLQEALEHNSTAMQTVFTDSAGNEFYCAYEYIPGMNTIVVTQIVSSLMDKRVNSAVQRIIIIGVLVLAISVLCMAFYSRTISRPLKELTSGVSEIKDGNYEPSLVVKTRDEIGVLTDSFIAMGRGLENFERFTNKQVVALAQKEKISRTGEKRTITICFTMIRNFSDLSQGMDSQHVVTIVNRFLSGLVPCVSRTGGLVDKYLTQSGIVVMCLWGAAEHSGSPVSNAFNCIRSALMMRNALREMNLERLSGGEPGVLIKMGCGINTGPAIVGQMGSEERMEYTAIGDTVNTAARLEEPNEAFDTDILISENTWRLVGKHIICEKMPSLKVKGKSRNLDVYSVINLKNYYGPSTMDEVRQLWQM